MPQIGSYLKILRSKNNVTLEELSGLTNSSKSNISKIEHNKYKPSDDFLKKISQIFSVSYDELFKIKYNVSIDIYNNNLKDWLLYKDINTAFYYYIKTDNITLDNIPLTETEKYILTSNIEHSFSLIRNLRKKC